MVEPLQHRMVWTDDEWEPQHVITRRADQTFFFRVIVTFMLWQFPECLLQTCHQSVHWTRSKPIFHVRSVRGLVRATEFRINLWLYPPSIRDCLAYFFALGHRQAMLASALPICWTGAPLQKRQQVHSPFLHWPLEWCCCLLRHLHKEKYTICFFHFE